MKARVDALNCFEAAARPARRRSRELPPAPVLCETRAEREARLSQERRRTEMSACCTELAEMALATAENQIEQIEEMILCLSRSVAHHAMRITPHHIEAAVKRELGIDMAGRLAELLEPLSESHAIYEAARSRIKRSSPGYDELLRLPELRDPALRQQSDDFETLYAQAASAQQVLRASIASSWRPHAAGGPLQVPVVAHAWVDEAVSPGVKGRARAQEKVRVDYAGDASMLKDLARATLTYTDCARMASAVRTEMGRSGLAVATLKNRFAYPTALGYSDLCATVRLALPEGVEYVAELQLSHPQMTAAKKAAHAHYLSLIHI